MNKSEHLIQDEIRLALSPYGSVFRTNAGKFYGGKVITTPEYGRIVINPTTVIGLPNGFSDLLFVGDDGNIAFIECKDATGRLRTEQEQFLKLMASKGYRTGVARSVADALKIIGR